MILERVSGNSMNARAEVRTANATHATAYSGISPNAIITSPPYGAAQKYPRATRIPLAFLSVDGAPSFREIDAQTIGREDLSLPDAKDECRLPDRLVAELRDIYRADARRGAIYAEYFHRMGIALGHQAKALLPGGHYLLVASNNTITGRIVPTHMYLAQILQGYGLEPVLTLADSIPSRSLLTKRAKTAGQPISHEYIHILKKPGNSKGHRYVNE